MILNEKCKNCGHPFTSIINSGLISKLIKGRTSDLSVETHYCTNCLSVFAVRTIVMHSGEEKVATKWQKGK